jgi:hypothetical protein
MPADSFTKVLPRNKWGAFLNHLNLVKRIDRLNYQELLLNRLQEVLEVVTLRDAAIGASIKSSLDRDPSWGGVLDISKAGRNTGSAGIELYGTDRAASRTRAGDKSYLFID